jgi:hypothetical protein
MIMEYDYFNMGFEKAYNFWEGDCDLIVPTDTFTEDQKIWYMEGYNQYMEQEYPLLRINAY